MFYDFVLRLVKSPLPRIRLQISHNTLYYSNNKLTARIQHALKYMLNMSEMKYVEKAMTVKHFHRL